MCNECKQALIDWVNKNYDSDATGWTSERSFGNYDDVFDDGLTSGYAWAAYEIEQILGMNLEEPDEPDYKEEY